MPLVADVSAVISQAFVDEDASYAQSVIAAAGEGGAVAPFIFWFELRNALLMGERRKRLTPSQTASFLSDLQIIGIEIDDSPLETECFELARRHRLTIYDAAYLELAARRRLPLATLDDDLLKAAKSERVAIFKHRRS